MDHPLSEGSMDQKIKQTMEGFPVMIMTLGNVQGSIP